MTFNCKVASKSADVLLLALVNGSKSEDMQLIVIKNEIGTQFFFKNVPILIRWENKIKGVPFYGRRVGVYGKRDKVPFFTLFYFEVFPNLDNFLAEY